MTSPPDRCANVLGALAVSLHWLSSSDSSLCSHPGVNSDTELKCKLISAPKGMTTTKFLALFLVLNEGPPNLLVVDTWPLGA